jgi:MFS family permease
VLHSVLLPSLLLLLAMFNATLIVAGLREFVIDKLGGTPRDAGLFFSIEMLAYVLFAPLVGLLSDRLGRRKPFVVTGFFASAPLYLSYGAVGSLSALFALRFVQGAVTVMAVSILMAAVLDQPDATRRGRYMGLMGGALILGISLGIPVGGYVSRHLGATAPLELGGVLFLGAGLASLWLRESRGLRPQVPLGEIRTALLARPRLLLPLAFHFIDRYTVGFFVVLFPLHLAALGVADPALRGRYLALFLLPFALLQPLTGRLTERLGPMPPLVAGSALYGVLLAVVGYAGLFGLWFVMAGLGVLAAVMFPPSMVLTAQLCDSRTRGSAMGGFNLAGSLGFAVGPLAGAAFFEAGGAGAAFVSSGVLELLTALAGWWVLRRPESAPGAAR